MADPSGPEGLQLSRDEGFQRRSWIVQRLGGALLVAVAVVAGAGLLGPGPATRASVATATGELEVAYPRFWRFGRRMRLEVRVAPEAVRDGELRVWVARAYLRGTRIASIVPAPAATELGADRLTFAFTAGEPAGAREVVFVLTPDRWGLADGRLGLDGGAEVRFRQVIYP